jgi:hypothetical protein
MNKLQAERLNVGIGLLLSVVFLILIETQMATILGRQKQTLDHSKNFVYFIGS